MFTPKSHIYFKLIYSLVPDLALEEGKRSGELWLNPWFSLYGAHRQGHAKLGCYGALAHDRN